MLNLLLQRYHSFIYFFISTFIILRYKKIKYIIYYNQDWVEILHLICNSLLGKSNNTTVHLDNNSILISYDDIYKYDNDIENLLLRIQTL